MLVFNFGPACVIPYEVRRSIASQEQVAMCDRKNVNCLATNELYGLREALAAMYSFPAGSPGSFPTITSDPVEPPIASWSLGAPGPLIWHRAYLLAVENALRLLGCPASLPRWNPC